ncbi:MAG: hypothetical protein QXL15_02660 [Candidatus Korarchaeota archaeon]
MLAQIATVLVGFVLLGISAIYNELYYVTYFYSLFGVVFWASKAKDFHLYGKIAVYTMLLSAGLFFLRYVVHAYLLHFLLTAFSDVGMMFFYTYSSYIMPKYAAKWHLKEEKSAVSSWHLHEGFVGILLVLTLTPVYGFLLMIEVEDQVLNGIIHTIGMILGGGGILLGAFLMGRDFHDVLRFRWITKISDEDNVAFWTPMKTFVEKRLKLQEHSIALTIVALSAGILKSPLMELSTKPLLIIICGFAIGIGGLVIGRDWMDMLRIRYGEKVNRPLMISLLSMLKSGEKISAIEHFTIPVWRVAIKYNRKEAVEQHPQEMTAELVILDETGEFLYIDGERSEIIKTNKIEIGKEVPETVEVEPAGKLRWKRKENDIRMIFPQDFEVAWVKNMGLSVYLCTLKKDKSKKTVAIEEKSKYEIKDIKLVSFYYVLPFDR